MAHFEGQLNTGKYISIVIFNNNIIKFLPFWLFQRIKGCFAAFSLLLVDDSLQKRRNIFLHVTQRNWR